MALKVFKFGGASVKSAEAVRNMANILEKHSQDRLVVVVSAMDKTTNLLERIHQKHLNMVSIEDELASLSSFHLSIGKELLLGPEMLAGIDDIVNQLGDKLQKAITSHDRSYDQIISFGEILSTQIIAGYLRTKSANYRLLDARSVIKTDSFFKDAQVDWKNSESAINDVLVPHLNDHNIITQGFIGSDHQNNATTLGREGSDFTGAILASILNAESLTVWKDVPGILTADPKRIQNSTKFEGLSYEEAAEMTYYGAKVIHPKTIKPLANKNIPLYVRPFTSPEDEGTTIHNAHKLNPEPSIIFKDDQTLISFRVEDYTFINEVHLSKILHAFTELKIGVNLMQNSAISFSTCIDTNQEKLDKVISQLGSVFSIYYNSNLQMITVKNYTQAAIDDISRNKEILLEQRSRHNYQIVVR